MFLFHHPSIPLGSWSWSEFIDEQGVETCFQPIGFRVKWKALLSGGVARGHERFIMTKWKGKKKEMCYVTLLSWKPAFRSSNRLHSHPQMSFCFKLGCRTPPPIIPPAPLPSREGGGGCYCLTLLSPSINNCWACHASMNEASTSEEEEKERERRGERISVSRSLITALITTHQAGVVSTAWWRELIELFEITSWGKWFGWTTELMRAFGM